MLAMYVVLLALLYVLLMMVVTAESIFKGVMTLFIGGGLIALVVYLLDTPRRSLLQRITDQADQSDARSDQ
jgi:hypothetical protein